MNEPMGPALTRAKTRSKTMVDKKFAELRERMLVQTEEFLSRHLKFRLGRNLNRRKNVQVKRAGSVARQYANTKLHGITAYANLSSTVT
jgi:hypothetical protein